MIMHNSIYRHENKNVGKDLFLLQKAPSTYVLESLIPDQFR